MTPVFACSSSVFGAHPESSTAWVAATRPRRINLSIFRCSFGSSQSSGRNEFWSSSLWLIVPAIFAGRSADTGKDPVPEFIKSIKLAKNYKNVEILWASVREPYNYVQAKQLGCHIITIPPKIIEKIQRFGKSFNQLTLETVKAFLIDSKKSKFKI